MNFGLSLREFESLKRLVIDPLKSAGARVFIFGSRATGKQHKYSDIDILIEAPRSVELQNTLMQVKEAIEESNFPIKVDLVHALDLAKSYYTGVMSDRIEI